MRIWIFAALLAMSLMLLAQRARVQSLVWGVDAHAAPPTVAPPLRGLAIDGRAVSLAELRGQPVLVHFWTFG